MILLQSWQMLKLKADQANAGILRIQLDAKSKFSANLEHGIILR